VNEQLWWHVSRATGVVAWGLLAISVLWGLFVSARLVKKKGVPAWSTEVHRFAAALAMVFTLGHLGSLIADSYIHFTLKDLVVPFASEYKTGPIAWGVVALWLLAAVQITSLLRNRIPRKLWRRTHALAFPLFAAAAFHTTLAGTDAKNPAMVVTNLGIIVLSTWFVMYRILTARSLGAIKVEPRRSVESNRPSKPPTSDDKVTSDIPA
jgi:predicted ferric reductase